jgi:small subunit ribosomal protein S2
VPAATLRQLLEAGVHFGHQTSRWNPKMRDYIFTSRDRVHIIDLAKTQQMLDDACDYVRELVAGGQKVLFVGTKKQAQDAIVEACARTGQPYVVHRWMGGMLTNFAVIQRQLKRLIELRAMSERGDFERMSGKEANENRDALERLERSFAGMVEMKRLPGALFVIDCKKERLAVTEANKLSIPIVAVVDTNCDPDLIQHVVPGNDDAIRSCRLMVNAISEAILEGQRLLSERELRERAETEAAAARAALAEPEGVVEGPESSAAAPEPETGSVVASPAEPAAARVAAAPAEPAAARVTAAPAEPAAARVTAAPAEPAAARVAAAPAEPAAARVTAAPAEPAAARVTAAPAEPAAASVAAAPAAPAATEATEPGAAVAAPAAPARTRSRARPAPPGDAQAAPAPEES